MATATIRSTFSFGGWSVTGTKTRTDEVTASISTTLEAATAGTLTTRTDNDTGVVTASGHTITTGDTVGVYWSSGGVNYRRYGMDATVAGDAVTIDGGSGDNLPSQDATVYICEEKTISIAFDGDDMSAIHVQCASIANVDFQTAVPASLWNVDLEAGYGQHWEDNGEHTRPITGAAVAQVVASQAATTAAAFTVDVLLNGV